jgi:hypothetical protein
MSVGQGTITSIKIFDSEVLAASGTATSTAIDLGGIKADGFFSIQIESTGTGTLKTEYLLSNNDSAALAGTYLTPGAASDITTTKASGNDIVSFAPIIGDKMKIKITEDGGAAAITVSAWICIQ